MKIFKNSEIFAKQENPMFYQEPGADPEFPVGGGANPPGGYQHMILPNFVKNCMKLRKFWAAGGPAQGMPP